MKPLGRDARSVIDAAREHEGIDEGDRDRLRRRVMARAAAAGAVIAATTAVSDVAAKSTATAALGSGAQLATKLGVPKLWLAVAITATGAGGAATVYAVRDVPPDPVVTLAPAVDRNVHDLSPRVADRARADLAARTAPPPVAADPTPSVPAAASVTAAASAPPGDARGASSSDALTAESNLLSRAQIAFGQGNLEAAIDLLYEHESRFPRGALAIERRALLAIALCKKGRVDEGTRTAGGLMDRSTPLGTRIADACERR